MMLHYRYFVAIMLIGEAMKHLSYTIYTYNLPDTVYVVYLALILIWRILIGTLF